MRKLLYSFFLIFLGNLVSANSGNIPVITMPTISTKPLSKTETLISIAHPSSSSILSYQVQVTGNGYNKTYRTPDQGSTSANPGIAFRNLLPGKTYAYTVIAITCDADTEVADCATTVSKSGYFQTPVDFPPAAVLQEEGTCPQYVGVNWTIPDTGGPVTGLVLKKSMNDGAEWHTVAFLEPHIRSYYDNGVIPGVHTTYMLHTVNALDEITSSNSVKIQVKPYVAPDKAINFRSDLTHKSDNTIRVAWENPAQDWSCRSNIRQAWYIMLKRSGDAEFKIYAAANPEANHYDITGLNQNETIEIGIFPISDKDLMGNWVTIKDETYGPAKKPSKVIGVAFKDNIDNSVIDIEWAHDPKDADYYIVEASIDGVNFSQLGIVEAPGKHLKHVNLAEGLPYTYRVKAGNYLYGESDWAYMDGYVTFDYSAIPNAPYGLTSKWSGSSVVLTWVDDSNKEEKYVIERASKSDGPFQEIGEVGRNVITYTDATMTGDSAFYRVKAENPLGLSASSKISKIFKAPAASSFSSVGILAYPNPTVDKLNISVPGDLIGDEVAVKVYNSINALVYTKNYNRSSEINIDFKRFTPGIYNVVVETGGVQETKKIVKN